jgi:hypothetical protein
MTAAVASVETGNRRAAAQLELFARRCLDLAEAVTSRAFFPKMDFRNDRHHDHDN